MYGVDLDVELAAQRYGWLLDRILDLPDPYSRFREAMSEDEEMAEMLLDLEEQQDSDDDSEGESSSLRYSQVGVQEMLLMSIDMGLKAMRAEAPHLHGAKGKPKYPDPWPTPRTALDRARDRRNRDAAAHIAAKFGFNVEDL